MDLAAGVFITNVQSVFFQYQETLPYKGDEILFVFLFPQAIDRRDALAKFIYASLFDWLVEQINKSLQVGKNHVHRSVSIVDICGFESFQV